MSDTPLLSADDPAATILDEAVAAARAMGIDCVGWMVQRDADSIIAWLYALDEQGRFVSLMDDVEPFSSLLDAARWCRAVVFDHALNGDGDEE